MESLIQHRPRRLQPLLALLLILATGCSDHINDPPPHGEVGVAVAPKSITGNSVSKSGPTTPVSGGTNTTGVLVPTATGVVGRIQNGLENRVKSGQGNFARGLRQVQTNLPNSANVLNGSGYDQVQLLAYSACADLTTGSTPLMQSVYMVQPSASIATNQSALVAAGMRILDQHTAQLASQGPASAQLNTIFTNMVQSEAADSSNTSTIAFMAVCIAANTAGTTLLGM